MSFYFIILIKIKYNLYFLQFTKKLKNNYFQNLNSLLEILEQLKNTPVVNNKTLNLISNEVKKIIDNMYNLTHYYYIYAIISLINADIEENMNETNQLQSIVSKALNK